jgi:LytR cell envelope-related transcriptional attenuator
MTMLSPLGRVPPRRPPVRRRTRRPVPALVLLVALFVLAAVVWWRVLHRGPEGSTAAACSGGSRPAVLSLDPRRVKVRVYNATERAGLARSVADQLRKRGFSIAATSNDPLAGTRTVSGVGELRYGSLGVDAAELLSWQLPGIRLAEDPRTDGIVDVAVGPSYRRLATAAQVNQAKQKVVAKAAAQAPTC